MNDNFTTPPMPNNEIIETLNGLVFGNFKITAKEREALARAVTIIENIVDMQSAEPEIEEKLGFLEFLWNVINPNEMEQCWSMYHCSGEEKIDG